MNIEVQMTQIDILSVNNMLIEDSLEGLTSLRSK